MRSSKPPPPRIKLPLDQDVQSEFDQIVKGNVIIKRLSEKKYKITFSKISKFIKYQVWSDSSKTLNENRKVYYESARLWITKFNYLNASLSKDSNKPPLFKPTTIMEIGNDYYSFVIYEAKIIKDRVFFKVSTEEINLSNCASKKMLKLPCGRHSGVRFDIDPTPTAALSGDVDITALLNAGYINITSGTIGNAPVCTLLQNIFYPNITSFTWDVNDTLYTESYYILLDSNTLDPNNPFNIPFTNNGTINFASSSNSNPETGALSVAIFINTGNIFVEEGNSFAVTSGPFNNSGNIYLNNNTNDTISYNNLTGSNFLYSQTGEYFTNSGTIVLNDFNLSINTPFINTGKIQTGDSTLMFERCFYQNGTLIGPLNPLINNNGYTVNNGTVTAGYINYYYMYTNTTPPPSPPPSC